MEFEWDERKNHGNLQKHGLLFSDVTSLFSSLIPFLVEYDARDEYGEDRWIGIGLLQEKNLVIVVVFTEPEIDKIRIISARKANKQEQKKYYDSFGK